MRLVVAVAALLFYRAATREYTILARGLHRLLDTVSPVEVELFALATVVIGEYTGTVLYFAEPIGLGFLYLAVFFWLVRVIYPASLWSSLEQAGVTRWFEAVIAFHVLGVFLVLTVFPPIFRELRSDLFFTDWYGFSPSLWFMLGSLLYFGLVMPISIAIVLSIPDGGLRSLPDPGGAALSFTQGFMSEAVTREDIDSPTEFWLNQGAIHMLPCLILGCLFVFFDYIYPTIEVLLVIGVVATLSPWQGFPPGDVRQYDLESRLAEVLRYATVNVKGLITALIIVAGVITGALIFVRLSAVPITHPAPGPRVLVRWNQLGFYLGLILFAGMSTLLWLSLADRLPWFISSWTAEHDTFEGRDITLSGDPTQRFTAGLSVPSLWVASSVTLPYSTHDVGPVLYALLWPIFLCFLFVRTLQNRSSAPPAADNRTIAWTITLIAVVGSIALLTPSTNIQSGLHTSLTGLLTIQSSTMRILLVMIIIVILLFYLPDTVHRINQQFSTRSDQSDRPLPGKQGEQRKFRLIFMMLTVLVIILLVQPVANLSNYIISPVGFYSIVIGCLFIVVVYRLDPEVIEEGQEASREFHIGFILLCSIIIMGYGIAFSFEPILSYSIFPVLFLLIGGLGVCGSVLLALHHYVVEGSFGIK